MHKPLLGVVRALVLLDIGDIKLKKMPPQDIINSVKRDVDPEYAYVNNQTLPLNEDIPIEVKGDIKKQADRLLKDLGYIFEYARQLDDSPFTKIWFR